MDCSNEPLKNATTVKGTLRHVGGLYSAATDAPLSPSAPISPDFHSHCELKSSFNELHCVNEHIVQTKYNQNANIQDAQNNETLNKESPLKFCKFLVAEDVAGFLVGRKGAGIEEFQSRHGPGVRVTVSKRGEIFPILYDRIATVVGISQKVHQALKEVIEVSVQRAMHKEAERRIDNYKRIIKPKGCFKLLVPESAIYYLFSPLEDGSIPIDNIGRKTNTEILCSIQGGHLNSHLLNMNIKESVIQVIGLVNNICESVLSVVDLYQADSSLPKFLALSTRPMEAIASSDMTSYAAKPKYYSQPPPPPFTPKEFLKPKLMHCQDSLYNRTTSMGSCFMEYPHSTAKPIGYEDYPLQPNYFEKHENNHMPYFLQRPCISGLNSPKTQMIYKPEVLPYDDIQPDLKKHTQNNKTRADEQDKQIQRILKHLCSGLLEENEITSRQRDDQGSYNYHSVNTNMQYNSSAYTDENNNETLSQSEELSECDQHMNDNMQKLFDYLLSITKLSKKSTAQDRTTMAEHKPPKLNEAALKAAYDLNANKKHTCYKHTDEHNSRYKERPLIKRQSSTVYTEIEIPSNYSTDDSEWSLIISMLHLASMANVSLKYEKEFNNVYNQKFVSAISISGSRDQVDNAMMMWRFLTQ